MQNLNLRNVFLTVLASASIAVFFGSQNVAFASDIKQDNWIAGTTLTQPGIPHILKGQNSLTPTWVWDASRSQILGTIHYSVEWCQRADFLGCSTNLMYTDSASFSFDNSNLLSNGIWYMRVRALDEYGHKSAYSTTGLGTINYFAVSAPYNVSATLDGNVVNLGWNDCSGLTFKVWSSATGKDGSFKVISETQSYVLNTDLGSHPQEFYYLTAIDKWGNESSPSSVVRIQTPGFLQAENSSLGADLKTIFSFFLGEPSGGWFGIDGGVLGARTDKVDGNKDLPDGNVFKNFIPLDYFQIKSD